MPIDTSTLDPILADLTRAIATGFLEQTFEIRGHKFTMRTINEADSNWRDGFITSLNPVALTTSRKAPTLAIATVSIDGRSVESLFSKGFDELDEDEQRMVKSEPEGRRYWAAAQLCKLFKSYPPDFINELFEAYGSLTDREQAAASKAPEVANYQDPTKPAAAIHESPPYAPKPMSPPAQEGSFESVTLTD